MADPTAEVSARVQRLLDEHPPKSTSTAEFWGAQFDLGLAWIHFPEGCGGMGISPKAQRIVNEALLAADASFNGDVNPMGVGMAAPTIVTYGSDAQKAKYLRRIFTCEDLWCQLFSEPGAGSDVASAATSARRDGDEWVINGQKVWTSLAHRARWGLLLARTDPEAPKHNGLSYFVVDMTQPGVEIRPIKQADGAAHFNEVFFTDARVPDAERLGDVGDGWRVAITTLMNERVHIGGQTGAPRGSGPISVAVREWHARGHRDQVLRDELMKLWCRAEVGRLTSIRAQQARKAGNPGPEGSVGKGAAAVLDQDIFQFCCTLMGADGQLYPDWSNPDAQGPDPRVLMVRARASTIAGGTTEVMKNILGERVLGLPGDVRVDRDVPWSQVPRN